jgi:phosphatidylglycerophosphate synthase
MKKLPSYLESPIDNGIYYIIEKIAPSVYSMGFTPNMITTLGNVCTLIFIYFFIQKRFYLSALFFFLSYMFDCLDGYLARSYNMTTEFGDLYDHTSDLLKTLSYIYLLFTTNRQIFFKILPIILVSMVLTFIHFAHQEIYYGKPGDSITLQLFTMFSLAKTKEEAEQYLPLTRYFGCGSTILLMTIIIIMYKTK